MFRRKARPDETTDGAPGAGEVTEGEVVDAGDSPTGPRDSDTLGPSELEGLIDFGSLLLPPPPEGLDVQMQIEEESGQVTQLLVTAPDGAVDLRAFAAPRNGDLWSDAREGLKADFAQHGAVTEERDGPWGLEVLAHLAMQTPDGQPAVQPQRIIGINGPRWLFRATLLGRAAIDFDSKEFDEVINSVVVRRGAGAVPAGESLPLTLPPGSFDEE